MNYQIPIKILKESICMELLHRYPPDVIDDHDSEAISSTQTIHYYFNGIKAEIKGNTFRVMDTTYDLNYYPEINNRFLLALMLNYIKTMPLNIKITQKKRYIK